MEKIDGYKDYKDMTLDEQKQVDKFVSDYYQQVDVEGIMNFMSKLDTDRIAKVSEKADNIKYSRSIKENGMRLSQLIDRTKTGFYNKHPELAKESISIDNNDCEVQKLKDEISDLKKGMNDIMSLLQEKLK